MELKLRTNQTLLKIRIWVLMLALMLLVLCAPMPLDLLAMNRNLNLENKVISSAVYLGFYLLSIVIAFFSWRMIGDKKPLKLKMSKKNIKITLISTVVIMALGIMLGYLNQLISGQSQTANQHTLGQFMKSNSLVLSLMIMGLIFLAPILEELVFRGFVIKGNLFGQNNLANIAGSGFLFSLVHNSTSLISFLLYLILGSFLAYLYTKIDDIKVPIGVHMLNNLLSVGIPLIL